jgi:hypothetical protein
MEQEYDALKLDVPWKELGRLSGKRFRAFLGGLNLSANDRAAVIRLWREHPLRKARKLKSPHSVCVNAFLYFLPFLLLIYISEGLEEGDKTW